MRSTRLVCSLVFLCAVLAASPAESRAQEKTYLFEVGGMVGRQSGLSFKASSTRPRFDREVPDGIPDDRDEPTFRSFDAHVTFNASGYVYVSGHVLRERNVSGSPLVAYFGPGLNIQLDDSAVFLGPSAEIGVFFALSRYRAFLQVVPQMHLVPELRGEVLAAAGLRLTL